MVLHVVNGQSASHMRQILLLRRPAVGLVELVPGNAKELLIRKAVRRCTMLTLS